MVPAQPPFPTPANLPFHFCSGSHTSKRMFDSLVGLIAPVTRQKAGRLVMVLFETGDVKDPAVMASAAVIVVLGSRCSLRLAHAAAGSVCRGAPADVTTTGRIAATIAMIPAGDLMTPPASGPLGAKR